LSTKQILYQTGQNKNEMMTFLINNIN